jgi:hypothetical protein
MSPHADPDPLLLPGKGDVNDLAVRPEKVNDLGGPDVRKGAEKPKPLGLQLREYSL